MTDEVREKINGDKELFSADDKARIAFFNQIANRLTKNTERPYSSRAGSFGINLRYGDYTVEDIKSAVNSLNAKQMREISNYYYAASSSYQRIIDFFSSLYLYYYTIDIKGLELLNKDAGTKLYNSTLSFVDGLDIEATFQKIATCMMVEGCFFGYVTFCENNRTTITKLDPDFCRTRYLSVFNTRIVEFDVRYFNKYNDENELKDTLKAFPKEVRKTYNLLASGRSDNYWAVLPPEESCAFTFAVPNNLPPLFDSIVDMLNFDTYKEIEKKRDSQELSKILIQKFNLDDNGNLNVLLEEMARIHEATSEIFREKDNIDVLTTIADSVELADVQETSNSARNNIEKMVFPKYENAGLSTELFASTSSTSLEYCVTNATAFMSQVINSFSTWISMVTYSRFNYRATMPIITILPITWYNQKKMREDYLKGAEYGYSLIAPYVALGKKQSTLLSCKYLENEILGLSDILKPLESSHTQSGSEEDAGAANVKDPEDKSEKTVKNQESK